MNTNSYNKGFRKINCHCCIVHFGSSGQKRNYVRSSSEPSFEEHRKHGASKKSKRELWQRYFEPQIHLVNNFP